MPTAEQIKQFIAGYILPITSGAAANWIIVHLHFLAAFHIGVGSVAGAISQVIVFGVTAALAWLTSHHILKGNYTPAAKSGTRGSRSIVSEVTSHKTAPKAAK